MNAMLLMSSALFVGGDPVKEVPPPPPITGPVVMHSLPSAGCANCAPGICAGSADPMPAEAKSGGLFSKIKARFTRKPKAGPAGGDCGCGHAVGYAVADDAKKTGLLARLRARLGGGRKANDCAGPCGAPCVGCWADVGACSLPILPGSVTPTTPGETPKQMEKGKDPKSAGLPNGGLTPVAGPAIPLGSPNSPF